MNWYKLLKLSQSSGEYWITEHGSLENAGDDRNHEYIVIERVVKSHIIIDNEFSDFNSPEFLEEYIKNNWVQVVEYMITIEGLITEAERDAALQDMNNESTSYLGKTYFYLSSYNLVLADLLKMNGASEEEANICSGRGDVRFYAAKNWGWVRVEGHNLESFSIGPKDLNRIAEGLFEAYGEDVENHKFNIYLYSTSKWYREVPYSVISSAKVMVLRDNYLNV